MAGVRGKPVFVKRYVELASDVDCVVKHFSGGPAFLFGHSFGGQLVLWTAQHFRLNGDGINREFSLVSARLCAASDGRCSLRKKLNRSHSRPSLFDRHQFEKLVA